MTMNRPDLYGDLAGRSTIGTFFGGAQMMGEFGTADDPRLAQLGYKPGQRTLQGQALDLQKTAEGNRREEFGRTFDLTQETSRRQRLLDERKQDNAMELETGVPYLGGQPMPLWMRPHAEWARQWQENNAGQPPTFQELTRQLGARGQRPEDFNNGQPYPGTAPTVAPGVIAHNGALLDLVQNKPVTAREAEGLTQERQSNIRVTGQQNGQPTYAMNPQSRPQVASAAEQQAWAQQARAAGVPDSEIQSTLAQYNRDAATYQSQVGGGSSQMQGGGMSMQRPMAAGDPYGGYGGSGATGGNYQGQVKSQEQRDLEERGRQADLTTGTARRGQDIDREMTLNAQQLLRERQAQQAAVENGQLDLAREHEGNITRLDQQRVDIEGRRADLEAELGRGKLAIDEGALTGTYKGQATLDRERLYGGSGQVGSGMTLDAAKEVGRIGGQDTLARRGQDADIALRTAQTLGVQSPDDVFQSVARARSMEGTEIPEMFNAFNNPRGLPSFGSFSMRRPQTAGAAPVQQQMMADPQALGRPMPANQQFGGQQANAAGQGMPMQAQAMPPPPPMGGPQYQAFGGADAARPMQAQVMPPPMGGQPQSPMMERPRGGFDAAMPMGGQQYLPRGGADAAMPQGGQPYQNLDQGFDARPQGNPTFQTAGASFDPMMAAMGGQQAQRRGGLDATAPPMGERSYKMGALPDDSPMGGQQYQAFGGADAARRPGNPTFQEAKPSFDPMMAAMGGRGPMSTDMPGASPMASRRGMISGSGAVGPAGTTQPNAGQSVMQAYGMGQSGAGSMGSAATAPRPAGGGIAAMQGGGMGPRPMGGAMAARSPMSGAAPMVGKSNVGQEDFVAPKANSVTAGMGVTLQRPDRMSVRNLQNMSGAERGILNSAYKDQMGLDPADLDKFAVAGAIKARPAARPSFR